MRGYARDVVFTAHQLAVRNGLAAGIAKVSERTPHRIRCHELAHAALKCCELQFSPNPWFLRDGHCGAIEHTWLADGSTVILDVYCPGRTPMVQLIDSFSAVGLYRPSVELRDDIDEQLVAQLAEEILSVQRLPKAGERWQDRFGNGVEIQAVSDGGVTMRWALDGAIDRVTLTGFLENFKRID